MELLLAILFMLITANHAAAVIFQDRLVDLTNEWEFRTPYRAPVNSSNCPFTSKICFEIGGGPQMGSDGRFRKQISTSGFTNVVVSFDVNVVDSEPDEDCVVAYSTNAVSCPCTYYVYGPKYRSEMHENLSLPAAANNNPYFGLSFDNWADETTELCLISNLIIYGDYINPPPTKNPTITPSLYPTAKPTRIFNFTVEIFKNDTNITNSEILNIINFTSIEYDYYLVVTIVSDINNTLTVHVIVQSVDTLDSEEFEQKLIAKAQTELTAHFGDKIKIKNAAIETTDIPQTTNIDFAEMNESSSSVHLIVPSVLLILTAAAVLIIIYYHKYGKKKPMETKRVISTSSPIIEGESNELIIVQTNNEQNSTPGALKTETNGQYNNPQATPRDSDNSGNENEDLYVTDQQNDHEQETPKGIFTPGSPGRVTNSPR